jgi:hypothetical protein
MTGFLDLIVPASRFGLLHGADGLTTYRFNTGAAPVLQALRHQVVLRAAF